MTVDVAPGHIDIAMPRLSDSMEEGTLVRWLVASGESVRTGQDLAEIETDKAIMVYQAEAAGILEILLPEGGSAPLGFVIARLRSWDAPHTPPAGGAIQPDGDAAIPNDAAAFVARAASSTVGRHESPRTEISLHRADASPVARRVARELEIELAELAGSGPNGRIVKADVIRAASLRETNAHSATTSDVQRANNGAALVGMSLPRPADQPAYQPSGRGTVQRQELTRSQQVIARRMSESKTAAPEFTVGVEADMTAAASLREELRAVIDADAVLPSINDLIVKACARALRRHPKVNGAYRDGGFELYERVNIGIAVAAPSSLLVPTIFDADRISLGEVARLGRTLVEGARAGELSADQMAGATFTVSNLGMMHVDDFTAVINPPQAAILAVGRLALRPVVVDGSIVARTTARLNLTCDHRILYGADAAAFLADVQEALRRPGMLVL